MTQQARDVGKFGLWVDHFEQNDVLADFAKVVANVLRR